MKKIFTNIDMRHNRIENVDNIYQKTEVDNIIKDLQTKIVNKVEKIEGKGLSTNDYTDEENALVHATKKEIIFSTYLEFPNVGEENVLYIAKDEAKSYVWNVEKQIYEKLDVEDVDIDIIQVVL